jgi:hypothetical protein
MSMSQRMERRTERRRRKYQHEHQIIEDLARAMASKAYEGMRQTSAIDPSIMAYWRGQAALALDFCLDLTR